MSLLTSLSYSEQVGDKDHCLVAQVWDRHGDSVAIIEPTDNRDVATSTAMLFAAAPEMLAALQFVIRGIDREIADMESKGEVPLVKNDFEVAKIRKAIRKATMGKPNKSGK